MTITAGQESALRDLESVAREGDALEVIKVTGPQEEGESLLVEIALSFKGLPQTSDGIPLRQRERFFVFVPAGYPLRYPHVWVPHQRWADWPHVQWTRHLCLYQAPETEWNPVDGMFGFIERLYLWVKRAAVNQLDAVGAPLHPPVAYVENFSTPLVTPYVNAPVVGDKPWTGFANITERPGSRIDVTGWSGLEDATPAGSVAAAVLLPQATSYEFPSKVNELLDILEGQGVSRKTLIRVLGRAATINGNDTQLLVLIGTPTRGVRDSGVYQQNLVAWLLDRVIANGLRLALEQFSPHQGLREIGLDCERLVLEWSKVADVSWCRLREARPEVTIRRDDTSPLAWFRNKTVAVWGCGAIGGHVAEALARAGVGKLILWDKSVVTPGVLVRQPFEDSDIGKNKATATRERLLRIIPGLPVEAIGKDILDNTDWADGLDMVINATASWPVAQHLEICRMAAPPKETVIASMVLGHHAHRALLYVIGGDYTGGTADLARKTKIEALRQGRLSQFVDDFWPDRPRTSFQPEPGCSEPTFIGAHAEVIGLIGAMLTKLAREVAHGNPEVASSHLFTAAGVDVPNRERREHSFFFKPDICLAESVHGYQVKIAPEAFDDLQKWILRSQERHGRAAETGGHIFGERNDAARIVWVTEVTGPPPGSKASPAEFVCGFKGVGTASKAKSRSTRGSVKFAGMWHTHPNGSPKPSDTDYKTMRDIVSDRAVPCPRSLLLVIGTALQDAFHVTGSLFSRGQLPAYSEFNRQAKPVTLPLPVKPKPSQEDGLVLGGEGFDAAEGTLA